MEGRIIHIAVGVTIETDDGPQKTAITLGDMRRHCRPERVDDLLDDLTLLIADVQAAQNGKRVG
jgi:hypothetical protein